MPLTLEQKTLRYWKVSSGWNGRIKATKMGKALETTCDIVCTTSPARPLYKAVLGLEDELVNRTPAQKVEKV